jgi:hypothetical protein
MMERWYNISSKKKSVESRDEPFGFAAFLVIPGLNQQNF